MDLKKWKIFQKLDLGFLASVKRVYLLVLDHMAPWMCTGSPDIQLNSK